MIVQIAKKILFLAPQPFFQWRGTPIRVGFDVQALAELGYEVDLLTLPIGAEKPIPGVRIFRVANPFRVENIPIGPSPHKAVFDVLIFFKALSLARRHHYSVIHAVEETAVIAWLISVFSGAKVIYEKHSDPASHKDRPLKNLVLSLYRHLENFAIRRADAVIATGPGLAEQSRRVCCRATIHQISDIASSLVESDPDRTRDVSARLKRNPGGMVVLYVGSFAVYQGIGLMFQSIVEVIRRQPAHRFVTIGGSVAEIAARKKWLAQQGIEDGVTFVGSVSPDALPDYLAAADILLSPRSSGVNSPLKLLDYLKTGRAIVATDSTANRQILDESCAVLTAPTPEAFASGIVSLAGDESARTRLGTCGRRLFDELYNFAEFKRRLKICYDALPA
jgi:glycosyltransferase involved in cell wall biosynthesis